MIHGIFSIAVLTDGLDELAERLGTIGLYRVSGDERVEALDFTCSLFATRLGAIAVLHPGDTSPLKEAASARPGIVGVALAGDDEDVAHAIASPRGRSAQALFGPMAVVRDRAFGTPIEIVTADVPAADASPLARIESIPWAVADKADAAAALEVAVGLLPDQRYSGLNFPDLGTTNALIFAGDHGYIDFNEATRPNAPVQKFVDRQGSGAYAVVLEPVDFDEYVQMLRTAGVPTATPEPVELRVNWSDGTTGIAARIVAIDRAYLHGARVFISEPTFPW